MRTPRVVLTGARFDAEQELSSEDAKHLLTVLRRRVGDAVEVVSGDALLPASISRVEGEGALAKVWIRTASQDAATVASTPRWAPWTVAVSLVKGSGMDQAVRNASEFGLEFLAPMVSERSQVKADSGRPARWERIAQESAKQCGRAKPLQILPVTRFADLVREESGGDRWIAMPSDQQSGGPGEARDRPTTVFVGPEGGFSPGELALAVDLGVRPFSFDSPVLKTPTAVTLVAAFRLVADIVRD